MREVPQPTSSPCLTLGGERSRASDRVEKKDFEKGKLHGNPRKNTFSNKSVERTEIKKGGELGGRTSLHKSDCPADWKPRNHQGVKNNGEAKD